MTAILDIKYLISVISVFLMILALAYTITKFIGKKSEILMGNRNMKIIERISLGMDKSICIISICDNYYLLAVSKQNIELIDKLDAEDIKNFFNNETPNHPHGTFDMYFTKYMKRQKKSADSETMDKVFFADTLKDRLKEIKKKNRIIKDYTDKEEKE